MDTLGADLIMAGGAARGWTARWASFGQFSSREVFTSPDGVEYVRAHSGRVDLEVPMKTKGLRPLQLRRLDAAADNLRSPRVEAAPSTACADAESVRTPDKE